MSAGDGRINLVNSWLLNHWRDMNQNLHKSFLYSGQKLVRFKVMCSKIKVAETFCVLCLFVVIICPRQLMAMPKRHPNHWCIRQILQSCRVNSASASLNGPLRTTENCPSICWRPFFLLLVVTLLNNNRRFYLHVALYTLIFTTNKALLSFRAPFTSR